MKKPSKDLIESDCHGFKMPDQEELKFTDKEIDEVRSTLIDKFSEFEEASQCLSMSTMTNHAAMDKEQFYILITKQSTFSI